jgi:hypothetical protein
MAGMDQSGVSSTNLLFYKMLIQTFHHVLPTERIVSATAQILPLLSAEPSVADLQTLLRRTLGKRNCNSSQKTGSESTKQAVLVPAVQRTSDIRVLHTEPPELGCGIPFEHAEINVQSLNYEET